MQIHIYIGDRVRWTAF